VPSLLPAEKFQENCVLFVTEKQPTSIAIGWNEPVSGRELHRWSSAPFTAQYFANNRHSRTLTLIGVLAIQDNAAPEGT
jgi:hypothetical protein